jgi:hypothetical protein
MQCHHFLRNLGGGKNVAFNSEMMSEEKEEKKVLFVSVYVISKMMVNAKQVCTKSIDDKEESG